MQSLNLPDDYFVKIIQNGYFIFNGQTMEINDNYLQKSDGSFRQAQLLSPTLYLVLEAVCKEIYNSVNNDFLGHHALYAGDIGKNEVTYKNQYNLFFKEVNKLSNLYSHYIKADIKDFFRYIDVNLLFNKIESTSDNISSFHIYLYKLLFEYIGKGRFPIIENSAGLSYLATKIYLHDIDEALDNYLTKKLGLNNFEMIRYVDDLYIFINTDKPDSLILNEIYLDFKNYYQSKLREVNLSLNSGKTTLKQSSEIDDDLKNSFYGGEIYDENIDIHQVNIDTYIEFLDLLISKSPITISDYEDSIEQAFSFKNVELSKYEVYNYVLYNLSDNFISNEKIINQLDKFLEEDICSYDVKKVVTAILNTKNGNLIRKFLNILFNKEGWYDAENFAAITYLLNRRFKHQDLINKLGEKLSHKSKRLYRYIEGYCFNNDVSIDINRNNRFVERIYEISVSPTTSQLYFLYFIELQKENYIIAHSYCKSYFDRITAEIQFHYGLEAGTKKPNYKKYYSESILKTAYENIEYSDQIINKAHNIRNSNPVNHGSATLIKGAYSKDEVMRSINDLHCILNSLIDLSEKVS